MCSLESSARDRGVSTCFDPVTRLRLRVELSPSARLVAPPSPAVHRALDARYPSFRDSGSYLTYIVAESDVGTAVVLVVGLVVYAGVFAVNSSVHSYLIVSYSNKV